MKLSQNNLQEPTQSAQCSTCLVEARGLTLRYGDQTAFADVSLSVARGKITAIIGPSGCGKTSFLNCLNRLTDLIPNCRVAGSLLMEQVDVLDARLPVVQHRRRVGMIFQKPNPFPMSVRRNITLGLQEHRLCPRRDMPERVEASLREVGLWEEVKDRLDSPALNLSGGQQQRLCIARALALKPKVLLMDEPCSALDPLSATVIEELITGLRERVTIIIITHNLAQARRVADDIAVFWQVNGHGQLIETGTTEDVFQSPKHPLTAAYIQGRQG